MIHTVYQTFYVLALSVPFSCLPLSLPLQRQQYIEQIEYFQHARLEVANKKKQVLRQTRTLGGPGKRTKTHGRRANKSGEKNVVLFFFVFVLVFEFDGYRFSV